MRWIYRLRMKTAMFFRRRTAANQLDEELNFHLEHQIAENRAAGMSEQEARLAALRSFGNPTALRDQARETWSWHWLEELFRDARFGLRSLAQAPGFTATAVLSLALGIGAATAIFSVVYAVLMNPYPYKNADRIARLTVKDNTGETTGDIWLTSPQIQQLRQSNVIEDVVAMESPVTTLEDSTPTEVRAAYLTANSFQFLGVPLLMGRGLSPADASSGRDPQPVAVLSYAFWRQHFNSDPEILGKTLQLNHKDYRVVGVTRPRFNWYSAEIYLPLALTQDPAPIYVVNFRLKPGITHAAGNAALQSLMEELAKETPSHFPRRFTVHVTGLNDWLVNKMGGTLALLFSAVALLLAIGCGNVSILQLARGTVRQHELAVRASLGAGRGRILRQLLTESLLLAIVGAVLGVIAAYGILTAIKLVMPPYFFGPDVVIGINLPVLYFSVAVALLTGILFGLWPALQLSNPEVSQMMQSSTRRVAGNVRGRRTHQTLIAGQIALTMLLLTAAGATMEGFERLVRLPLGYSPHHVMSVFIQLQRNTYVTWPERKAYFERLQAKVAEVPGVTTTAVCTNGTPPLVGWNTAFELPGKQTPELPSALLSLISPEFFGELRILPVTGRIWSTTENHNGAHVAVVNQTFARRFFPGSNAIGHSIKMSGFDDRPPDSLAAPGMAGSWLQIIGIVQDSLNDGLRGAVKPEIFLPYTLGMTTYTQILVKSDVPPLALTNAIKGQLVSINPELGATFHVMDLESWISSLPEWQQERLVASIFAAFAVLALALAAVGLYSVVSYSVAQRTNEFGIRMALGAQRGHVLRIVFASTIMSVGSGILAGLALTLALNKVLAHWAAGSSRDPLILLAGTLVLEVVAGLACTLPAQRASRVDPMTALRSD